MRPLIAAMLVGTLNGVAVDAQEQFGTAKEAEAMVGRAVSHVQAAGPEKAYQDFTNRAPAFFDRDLFVVVYDLKGRALAHGGNPKMVGKDLLGMRDADGKPFVKERIEFARNNNTFWHSYRFSDPSTQSILPKSTYCERVESTVVCVGIYKR
jgi:cytochrome c